MADRANKYCPYCEKAGIERLMASGRPDHGSFGFLIVCGGTGTDTVLFSSLGFSDMADANYAVVVNSEPWNVVVDESTKAPTGFNLLNGAGGEVANVSVFGKLKSMVR